jgi:hypothetical protein
LRDSSSVSVGRGMVCLTSDKHSGLTPPAGTGKGDGRSTNDVTDRSVL